MNVNTNNKNLKQSRAAFLVEIYCHKKIENTGQMVITNCVRDATIMTDQDNQNHHMHSAR